LKQNQKSVCVFRLVQQQHPLMNNVHVPLYMYMQLDWLSKIKFCHFETSKYSYFYRSGVALNWRITCTFSTSPSYFLCNSVSIVGICSSMSFCGVVRKTNAILKNQQFRIVGSLVIHCRCILDQAGTSKN